MGPSVPQQAQQRVCACASEVALILPRSNWSYAPPPASVLWPKWFQRFSDVRRHPSRLIFAEQLGCLGANIGTTVIVQVLSFNVSAAAPVLFLAGLLAFNFGGRASSSRMERLSADCDMPSFTAARHPNVSSLG
jgi:Na+/Pi-cotransporter